MCCGLKPKLENATFSYIIAVDYILSSLAEMIAILGKRG
jgi:hypothetical protein